MNRESQIDRAVLRYLDQLDGGATVEALIHASVGLQIEPRPSLAEFSARLRHCDQQGWIIGVHSRVLDKMKWSLADAGKAALMEMR